MPDRVPEAATRVVRDARRRARGSTACGSARCAGGAPRRGALLEPWAGAVVNSAETVRAFRAEVRGVRLLVDTGHVADWGGDPCELLDLADHVQLRQGKPRPHAGARRRSRPASSTSPRCSRALDGSTTGARLSVEYFDLPDNGWPLDDPERWARDLAARLRALNGVTGHARRFGRSGGAGPGREGEAGRRHALERDEVAGDRVGDEQRAQVGAAEAAVGAEALALDRPEVDDRAVGLDDADAVLDVDAT